MRRYRDELILVGAALLPRILYMFAHAETPYFNKPILDSLWIHQWAQGLADGSWSSDDAYFRAPLYPYLVSLVYRVVGPNPWVVEVLQHLVGVITVLLVHRLGAHLFGRVVGLTAGLFLALYGLAPFFEGELLIVSVATALGLGFATTMVKAGGRPSVRSWILAGVWLGLAIIARPNFFVWLPLAVLYPVLRLPVRRAGVVAALWVLAGVVPVVAPVLVRNLMVSGDLVPVATQGGLNFYIGNGPDADGRTARAPGTTGPMSRAESETSYRDNITIAGEEIAEAAMGRPLRGAEVSRYWMDRALDHVGSNPGDWAGLMFRKTYYLLNNFEISDNRSLAEVPVPVMSIVRFGVIAALGVAGVFLISVCLRNGFIIVFLTFLYSFSITLFFVNARLRFPIVPLIAILAAVGLWGLIGTFPVKRPSWVPEIAKNRLSAPNRAILWSLVVLAAVFSHTRLYGVDSESGAAAYRINRAFLLLEQGDCAGALADYRTARESDPSMLEAAYGEARALERCGQLAAARDRYRSVISGWPSFVHGHLGLGRSLVALGDTSTAETAYLQAVDASGGAPEGLESLAGYYLRTGRFADAATAYERLLGAHPGRLNSWLNYGYTLSASGRLEEAITAWEQVIKLSPSDRAAAMARENIARARGGGGESNPR